MPALIFIFCSRFTNLFDPIIGFYNNPVKPDRDANDIEYMPIDIVKIKPTNNYLIIKL